MRRVGIMSALEEEMHAFLERYQDKAEIIELGNRSFYRMPWNNLELIVVFSRWGKVASASTATLLIAHFQVDEIIFSGVAGAIDPKLNIGDIIIGRRFLQHDMDPRPIFKRFEVPLTGKTYIHSDTNICEKLEKTALIFLENEFLNQIDQVQRDNFKLTSPKVYVGDILTGDQFIHLQTQINKVNEDLKEPGLCVEMEGAAIAQVCLELGVPFGIMRIISDTCDDHSKIDFPRFTNMVSSIYMREIVTNYLNTI